jgi:hypothetical protein
MRWKDLRGVLALSKRHGRIVGRIVGLLPRTGA